MCQQWTEVEVLHQPVPRPPGCHCVGVAAGQARQGPSQEELHHGQQQHGDWGQPQTEEVHQDLSNWVSQAGHELVYTDYQGGLNYLVTPVTGGRSRHGCKNHVSSLWLEVCLDQDQLLEVD